MAWREQVVHPDFGAAKFPVGLGCSLRSVIRTSWAPTMFAQVILPIVHHKLLERTLEE